VCSFRCEGAIPEIPEIFPEILDFPETPEKSPEYPGFTDKFVLSGDFQDSPIHPPRRHQDPFNAPRALILPFPGELVVIRVVFVSAALVWSKDLVVIRLPWRTFM
jgi:hypothetical protein